MAPEVRLRLPEPGSFEELRRPVTGAGVSGTAKHRALLPQGRSDGRLDATDNHH